MPDPAAHDPAHDPADDHAAPAPPTRVAHRLDNPVWAALRERQTHLGEVASRAGCFHVDVSVLAALDDDGDAAAWAELAALTGPGRVVAIFRPEVVVPSGWDEVVRFDAIQMVGESPVLALAPEPPVVEVDGEHQAAALVELTEADVPDMLALVAATVPGPFERCTIEMGRYVGIRVGGRLIAMAGERLAPPGYTEVSAVCVAEDVRGQGLGAVVVRAVTSRVVERGETPILHLEAGNVRARRVYDALGFVERRRLALAAVRVAPG